jgi:hypothetical protein
VAIKGKSKSRGRRLVAASPRPQLMMRKKPFWVRWWFLSVVGLVIAGIILFGILRAVDHRNAKKRHERLGRAVSSLVTLVQDKFPGTAQQLGATQYQMFPSLQSDLDKLAKGAIPASTAEKTAKRFAADAKKSGDGIQAVQVEKIIPEEFTATRLEMVDARFAIVQSFRTDETIAQLMVAAANADPDQRKAIVAQAQALATQAAAQFDFGYQKLVNIGLKLGVLRPSAPQLPGSGIPGG